MSFPLAVPINRHEGVSWQLVAPYTTNKQMLLPCLWALVKVDGSAFWWLYYCLSETLWSSWGSFPPQTSWEGRDCRASAVVVLFLGPWAENTRGACVCVGQKKCTSALSMPVVANHTSFLVLDYMTQIECGQCTEEKRLSDGPSRGSEVVRFRARGGGSDGGNICSSEGVC